MRKRAISFITFLMLMLICSPLLAINADDINKSIHDKGAGWVAGDTSISKLSPEDRKRLLPMKPVIRPGKELKSDTYHAEEVLPAKIDWRNFDGHNYVTSIKNQEKCGACYAFATTAVLESRILITSHTPDTDLDLSEQSMISCDPSSMGCGGGFLDSSIDFLKTTGAPLEACYPFTSGESGTAGDCAGCADWRQNTYRVTSFKSVSSSVESIKSAVAHNGPVVTAFVIYTDFLYYKSGVYRHVSGTIEGGHDVVIVGYDDEEQCWIVKNSWGPDWGDNGYFRVAMGTNECMVETEVFSIDYATVPGPSFVLSPSEIDFGMLFLPDQPYMTRTFTITNNGSVPLTDTSFTVTDPKYSVISLLGINLDPAASADIEVMYTGQTGRTIDTAELHVDAAGISKSIPLSGQANTRPDQPVNLQPADGRKIILAKSVTLCASEFEDEDGDSHEASRWIIKDSSGNIVYSSPFDTASKTSFNVPSGTLQGSTQYYWQVIYLDDRGAESPASSLTSFTTATGSSSSGGGNCFINTAMNL